MRKVISLVLVLMLAATMSLAEGVEAPVVDRSAIAHIAAYTYVSDYGQFVSSFVLTFGEGFDAERLNIADFSVENAAKHPLNGISSFGVYRVEASGAEVALAVDPFLYNAGFVVRCTLDGEEAFSFDVASVDEMHCAVVDDFQALTTNSGLSYRLFVPDVDAPLPLIVTFHGGGESGTDNLKQMANNRITTKWAESVSQAQYPCVVLGPQSSNNWSDEELTDVRAIIDDLIAEGVVDANRVYAVGIAYMEATLRFCVLNTDLIAAAIPMIYWKEHDPDLSSLIDMPLWFAIAENDFTGEAPNVIETVDYLTNELGNPNVRSSIYTNDEMNAYGLYGGLYHWGWIPAINNPEMVEWLFSYRK